MPRLTFKAKYSPRAERVGVLSNFRAVSARARGPMNGRQPIVKVIPAAKMTASTTNTDTRLFLSPFIYGT